MDPFTQVVDGWHEYYIVVGTAAATLVGLLFVGLSVNLEKARRPDSTDYKLLAAQTFNSLFFMCWLWR